MNYELLGSASGREVYLFTYDNGYGGEPAAVPSGFSVSAMLLWPDWQVQDLIWSLNALYGGLNDWTEFARDNGVRSFAFYGERADDASTACDALAFAWTQGSDAEYEEIMSSSHDESTADDFVENMFSGEILAGDRYAGKLANLIFAVKTEEQAAQARTRVVNAIVRHARD